MRIKNVFNFQAGLTQKVKLLILKTWAFITIILKGIKIIPRDLIVFSTYTIARHMQDMAGGGNGHSTPVTTSNDLSSAPVLPSIGRRLHYIVFICLIINEYC